MRRHLAEVALVVACGAYPFVAVLFALNYNQGQDIKDGQRGLKDAVHQIQQSRIVLTKQSCRQRNKERAITRSNLQQNLVNLAHIPDAGLAQLGLTRAEAVAQVNKQIRQVAPLDCKKLIKQVAGSEITKPKIGRGGGPGANAAPRPPARKPSRRPTGDRGGPSPTQPERPPPHGPRTGPPSGNPPPGGSGGKPPGNGDGGLVEPPTVPHPNPGGIVQSLVDGVGRIVQRLLP